MEFPWPMDSTKIEVRDRSGLDNSGRNIEMIAPEEIALALETVVDQAHSIDEDELLVVVASSFGIQRMTSNIKSALKRQLLKLINGKKMTLEGSIVSLSKQ